MTPAQNAAERHVINTARRIEHATQYGYNTSDAVRAYQQARTEQTRLRSLAAWAARNGKTPAVAR